MVIKHPDPKKHLEISLVKSGIRIAGYLALGSALWSWGGLFAATLLVISELLGIYEELV